MSVCDVLEKSFFVSFCDRIGKNVTFLAKRVDRVVVMCASL